MLGSEYSPWYKEDDLNIIDFANLTGVLFALTADGKILRFNDDTGTEEVEWYVETDEINHGYLGNTYSLKLKN